MGTGFLHSPPSRPEKISESKSTHAGNFHVVTFGHCACSLPQEEYKNIGMTILSQNKDPSCAAPYFQQSINRWTDPQWRVITGEAHGMLPLSYFPGSAHLLSLISFVSNTQWIFIPCSWLIASWAPVRLLHVPHALARSATGLPTPAWPAFVSSQPGSIIWWPLALVVEKLMKRSFFHSVNGIHG